MPENTNITNRNTNSLNNEFDNDFGNGFIDQMDEIDGENDEVKIKGKGHELDSLTKAFNETLDDENEDETSMLNSSKASSSNSILIEEEEEDDDDDDDDNENSNSKKTNSWQTNHSAKTNLANEEQDLLEEVEAQEIDGFDENKLNSNEDDLEENERETRSDNNKKSSFLGSLLSKFQSNGQYNLRSIGAITLIGGFILAVLFSMNTKEDNKKAKQGGKDLPSPEQVKMVETTVDNSELEPVTTKYFPEVEKAEPQVLPTVTIPPVILPPPGEPLRSEKPVESAKPVEIEEGKEFGIELRAGTERALKTINPSTEITNEKGEEVSLDGLTIQMILLEPFRSGISSLVKAQVMADVINQKGELVIRANSRVQVPFERFEIDGRVMNDSDRPAQIFLANGKKLNVKGIVKGIDGFAGIRGRIKKLSKGNVFARMGRTVGRVGARVVGVSAGGFAGRGLEDTINESVDQNTDFIPSGRIVEVLPGTRFTFTATNF